MNFLKLAFKRETAMPMFALTFASAACVILVCARMVWMQNPRYAFLIWNLFLAWLPLVFALLAYEKWQNVPGHHWHFLGLAAVWLLFFPNAPYIFTDLVHLTTRFASHFWVDLILILLCALTGLVLGFVSLFLMQSVARHMFGTLASWFFVAVVAGLSGFGIYLGRFMRFNSWDIVFKPFELYRGISTSVAEPLSNPKSLAFPGLFATFLFVTYVMLYALTRLQPAPVKTQSA
jgi:uncharacterized membrane protein